MPRLLARVFQNRDMNIVLRSDTIESGSLCRQIMFLINSSANCGSVIMYPVEYVSVGLPVAKSKPVDCNTMLLFSIMNNSP